MNIKDVSSVKITSNQLIVRGYRWTELLQNNIQIPVNTFIELSWKESQRKFVTPYLKKYPNQMSDGYISSLLDVSSIQELSKLIKDKVVGDVVFPNGEPKKIFVVKDAFSPYVKVPFYSIVGWETIEYPLSGLGTLYSIDDSVSKAIAAGADAVIFQDLPVYFTTFLSVVGTLLPLGAMEYKTEPIMDDWHIFSRILWF